MTEDDRAEARRMDWEDEPTRPDIGPPLLTRPRGRPQDGMRAVGMFVAGVVTAVGLTVGLELAAGGPLTWVASLAARTLR